MLQEGCSPIACPEMRSVDCQYLCATHDKPRECPATDYIVHTLDYTIALLNSSKLFPSRYVVISHFLTWNRVMIQDGPMQYLHSSARRLYRIFIHAYENHNEAFRQFEVSPWV
jgi:Mob1/phocein family